MKKIEKQFLEERKYIYQGILFNNSKFGCDDNSEIKYEFNCPEFIELNEKYDLAYIAKSGSEFQKAKRLVKFFAPKLYHSSWYDNHIECNALKLLEYSFDNKDQGINCLNKSKIIQECCLALKIFARRVSIMPFSPYDFDNHVVVEIFDSKLNKWIMIDPTTNGYFIDADKTPLSLLEIRNKFALDEFVTFVLCNERTSDLEKLKEKHLDINSYICKNLFYFNVEEVNTFGEADFLYFVPENYVIKDNIIKNLQYRVDNLPDEYQEFKGAYIDQIKEIEKMKEPRKTNIENMRIAPR